MPFVTRRQFLASSASALFLLAVSQTPAASAKRDFQICANVDLLNTHPRLLDLYKEVGIGTVWIAGFFYGHWPWRPDQLGEWRRRIEAAGLQCQVATVPLGHPGDSLGSTGEQAVPLSPPAHWRMASRPDGTQYSGTSLHAPATEENVRALKDLEAQGFREAFLDDDYRLAVGPGVIGGCFCDEHRNRFLSLHGYSAAQWDALLADVKNRALSPMVRTWVEFTCDELTTCFRDQQKATSMAVSIMVMYLGAEKAGIRLRDYADVHMRVGELMFNDAGFAPVKGKTDELFSALFHRRFVSPTNAFSETTIFPEKSLSAKNLAAKLAVSTLADVRHTLFMSGLAPIPEDYWPVVAPAMADQRRIHEAVAGHTPRGPLKHYHGEAERYVGADKPFSLFLATGIPFEVTGELAADGWTFLGDADARAVGEGNLKANGTRLLSRIAGDGQRWETLTEDMESIFAWKDRVLPEIAGVPVVMDRVPCVCAWYPEIRKALVWNLTEERQSLHLRHQGNLIPLTLSPLGTTVVDI